MTSESMLVTFQAWGLPITIWDTWWVREIIKNPVMTSSTCLLSARWSHVLHMTYYICLMDFGDCCIGNTANIKHGFCGVLPEFMYLSDCSPPGLMISGAPHQKRAPMPPQCLTRTSSAWSRGCRPSVWTNSVSSCPQTTRKTPNPPIQSHLVGSPARTWWRMPHNFMSKKTKWKKWK